MNFLLISKYYPPQIDGVGDYTKHLAHNLQQRGHSAYVLTHGNAENDTITNIGFDNDNDIEAETETKNENETLSASVNEVGGIIYTQHWDASLAKCISQQVQEKGITHIIWQYVPYSYQSKGMPWWLPKIMEKLKTTGVHQSIFYHEVALRLYGYGAKQGIIAKVQRKIATAMHSHVQASFTSINLYAQYFSAAPPVVIPIPANIIPVLSQKPIVRQANTVCCFANRVTATLIEALKDLPIQLVIAGKASTQQTAAINHWLQDPIWETKASFYGVLSAQALSHLMQKATYMVQPEPVNRGSEGGISLKNGSLAAALAHGLVVISQAGDMTDNSILIPHTNIVFVAKDDAEEWHNTLANLLANTAIVAQISSQALQCYQQHITWAKHTNRILQFL